MHIRKEKEAKKHVLKIINRNTMNMKKKKYKFRSIIRKNITLSKSNVLPFFSKGYLLDLLHDLKYFNNLLKEY